MEKYKILVVEDDDLMQGMLKDALSREPFEVTFTPDGFEGWKLFRNEEYDLVLLDLRLPGIDGIKLLQKMKKINPDIIIIMMTGYGTIETAVEAMKNGAYDYITKPFLSEELVLLFQKALEFKRLKSENILLRKELQERYSLRNIIGKSKSIQEIYRLIEVIADRNSTVLIQGESGTGKELIAEALHHLSHRKDKPLIKVSCAALPETLLESELFGHEKGAFTDASKKKIGRIEYANHGTLFLDDVDDMSLNVQVKLLRVLQEKEFERVGGTTTIKVDVRIVAASKTILKRLVDDGKFREDLYYRLNVVPICLPPLRERKEDIPLLINHFLKKYGSSMNKKVKILPNALNSLMKYNWPGNVRELENIIERMMAISMKNTISMDDLPTDFLIEEKWTPCRLKSIVQNAEKDHILKVLEMTGGIKKNAAQILGITPKTLWQKVKEYEIDK